MMMQSGSSSDNSDDDVNSRSSAEMVESSGQQDSTTESNENEDDDDDASSTVQCNRQLLHHQQEDSLLASDRHQLFLLKHTATPAVSVATPPMQQVSFAPHDHQCNRHGPLTFLPSTASQPSPSTTSRPLFMSTMPPALPALQQPHQTFHNQEQQLCINQYNHPTAFQQPAPVCSNTSFIQRASTGNSFPTGDSAHRPSAPLRWYAAYQSPSSSLPQYEQPRYYGATSEYSNPLATQQQQYLKCPVEPPRRSSLQTSNLARLHPQAAHFVGNRISGTHPPLNKATDPTAIQQFQSLLSRPHMDSHWLRRPLPPPHSMMHHQSNPPFNNGNKTNYSDYHHHNQHQHQNSHHFHHSRPHSVNLVQHNRSLSNPVPSAFPNPSPHLLHSEPRRDTIPRAVRPQWASNPLATMSRVPMSVRSSDDMARVPISLRSSDDMSRVPLSLRSNDDKTIAGALTVPDLLLPPTTTTATTTTTAVEAIKPRNEDQQQESMTTERSTTTTDYDGEAAEDSDNTFVGVVKKTWRKFLMRKPGSKSSSLQKPVKSATTQNKEQNFSDVILGGAVKASPKSLSLPTMSNNIAVRESVKQGTPTCSNRVVLPITPDHHHEHSQIIDPPFALPSGQLIHWESTLASSPTRTPHDNTDTEEDALHNRDIGDKQQNQDAHTTMVGSPSRNIERQELALQVPLSAGLDTFASVSRSSDCSDLESRRRRCTGNDHRAIYNQAPYNQATYNQASIDELQLLDSTDSNRRHVAIDVATAVAAHYIDTSSEMMLQQGRDTQKTLLVNRLGNAPTSSVNRRAPVYLCPTPVDESQLVTAETFQRHSRLKQIEQIEAGQEATTKEGLMESLARTPKPLSISTTLPPLAEVGSHPPLVGSHMTEAEQQNLTKNDSVKIVVHQERPRIPLGNPPASSRETNKIDKHDFGTNDRNNSSNEGHVEYEDGGASGWVFNDSTELSLPNLLGSNNGDSTSGLNDMKTVEDDTALESSKETRSDMTVIDMTVNEIAHVKCLAKVKNELVTVYKEKDKMAVDQQCQTEQQQNKRLNDLSKGRLLTIAFNESNKEQDKISIDQQCQTEQQQNKPLSDLSKGRLLTIAFNESNKEQDKISIDQQCQTEQQQNKRLSDLSKGGLVTIAFNNGQCNDAVDSLDHCGQLKLQSLEEIEQRMTSAVEDVEERLLLLVERSQQAEQKVERLERELNRRQSLTKSDRCCLLAEIQAPSRRKLTMSEGVSVNHNHPCETQKPIDEIENNNTNNYNNNNDNNNINNTNSYNNDNDKGGQPHQLHPSSVSSLSGSRPSSQSDIKPSLSVEQLSSLSTMNSLPVSQERKKSDEIITLDIKNQSTTSNMDQVNRNCSGSCNSPSSTGNMFVTPYSSITETHEAHRPKPKTSSTSVDAIGDGHIDQTSQKLGRPSGVPFHASLRQNRVRRFSHSKSDSLVAVTPTRVRRAPTAETSSSTSRPMRRPSTTEGKTADTLSSSRTSKRPTCSRQSSDAVNLQREKTFKLPTEASRNRAGDPHKSLLHRPSRPSGAVSHSGSVYCSSGIYVIDRSPVQHSQTCCATANAVDGTQKADAA